MGTESTHYPTVYVALRRLESKGLVTSRMSEPTSERGGRSRRYFKVEPEALERLRDQRDALLKPLARGAKHRRRQPLGGCENRRARAAPESVVRGRRRGHARDRHRGEHRGLAAALFGVAPAVRVSRVDLAAAFQSAGARGGTGAGEERLQGALVVAEVALVVALLVGAGMMMRTVRALGEVDPGFGVGDRVAARFSLSATRYPETSRARFARALIERVGVIPGVLAAGTVTTLPLSGGPGYTSFHLLRSLPSPEPGSEPIGGMEIVSPGYFEAMGIPVLGGRDFGSRDLTGDAPVAMIDEGVIERAALDGDPLTDAIRLAPLGAGGAAAWREVVGDVGSVRYGLDADPRPPPLDRPMDCAPLFFPRRYRRDEPSRSCCPWTAPRP